MDLGSININAIIQQTVDETNPINPCVVTDDARKATEDKLYDLPGLCEKLEDAEGLEALLLSMEIRRIKKALEAIQPDPYYSLIPAKYFQGAKERTSAAICACDKATVWRNRKRLLDDLALRLFGVSAWGEMKNW